MEEVDIGEALERASKEWEAVVSDARNKIQAIAACGDSNISHDLLSTSLRRTNSEAQDCLSKMRSLLQHVDILAPQHPSYEQGNFYQNLLQEWKDQYDIIRLSLRKANIQAKIQAEKRLKEERELLLGGGKEATLKRRNLETQAGMVAASESITETLRHTRQMMVQELDRGGAALATLDHSNVTLRKAESEYTGQRSLLSTTRRLLSKLQRDDILDRIIWFTGALVFAFVCAYILQKHLVPFNNRRYSSPVPSTPCYGSQCTNHSGDL